MRQRVPHWGVSPLSRVVRARKGAVDDVFEVSVYVPWREEGGGATGSGVFPDVVFYIESRLPCRFGRGVFALAGAEDAGEVPIVSSPRVFSVAL